MHPILPMVFSAGFIFDALKPARYWIEKAVVASSVPSVAGIPNRKRLIEFPHSDNTSVDAAAAFFDHSLWDALLKEYIVTTDGTIGSVQGIHLVDYQGLAKDARFDEYLSKLASTALAPKLLSQPEQLAFWMNAYNALCISLIVQDMKKKASSSSSDASTSDGKVSTYKPVASINHLSIVGGADDKKVAVWDLPAGIVGGQTVSLNHIEHVELRAAWNEPSIHACIVCASASCPNLRAEAYTGTRVQEQMKDQVQSWMQNPTKGLSLIKENNNNDSKNNVLAGWFHSLRPPPTPQLELSRIFLWFAEDFGGWQGLQEWLPQYIADDNEEIKVVIQRVKAGDLRYFEYNWELNGAAAAAAAATVAVAKTTE
jgi:Protein of unknown function, DUF547